MTELNNSFHELANIILKKLTSRRGWLNIDIDIIIREWLEAKLIAWHGSKDSIPPVAWERFGFTPNPVEDLAERLHVIHTKPEGCAYVLPENECLLIAKEAIKWMKENKEII